MTKRIIFVDDEDNVLQGLRRMLHPLRQEWDMTFSGTPQEALALMAQQPYDVIVSDMRMPGMDGAQLLREVMRLYPHMVRIVLSGHSAPEMILRSVGPTHQFLSKPCDADLLKRTVARACALRGLLTDATLKGLVAGMPSLPSLPTLYLEVMEQAQAPDSSLEKIGKIVERDLAMTAKVLQLVNSAFFGLRRQVSNPVQAVSLLGLDTIKAIILSVQVFAHFEPKTAGVFSLDDLWHHSMAMAACAKRLAKSENCDRKMIDDAFMAGLLHDVGKLILSANLPQQFDQVLQLVQTEGIPEWQAEQALLGATHAEVGAYLLGLWGLPDPIIEALAFHHTPAACPDRTLSPLTMVHVANGLSRVAEAAGATASAAGIDQQYCSDVGLAARLPAWREQCDLVLTEGRRQ